jgi:hypothetical protein
VWTFRYRGSRATATADVTVQGGQITDIFWAFAPAPTPEGDPSPIELGRAQSVVFGLWPTIGSMSVLAIIGILIRVRASPSTRPRTHGQLLRALRDRRSSPLDCESLRPSALNARQGVDCTPNATARSGAGARISGSISQGRRLTWR